MLQWDVDEEMWVERDFKPLIPSTKERRRKVRRRQPDYVGERGATERIGRSIVRRRVTDAEYRRLRKATNWRGPYLPKILEACRENETAEEYQHGETPYGAFTYALCHVLRRAERSLTFRELVAQTAAKISRHKYAQRPTIVGPKRLLDAAVPWLAKSKRSNRK